MDWSVVLLSTPFAMKAVAAESDDRDGNSDDRHATNN